MEAPLGLNLGDVDLEKLSDTLEQVADFDKMFKQIAESQDSLCENIPATVNTVSASDNAIQVDSKASSSSSKKRKLTTNQELSTPTTAKKAKHTDTVKNVNINISMDTFSDTLTTPDPLECGYPFDFEEGFSSTGLNHSEGGGYGSDSPFSPGSDLSSPTMPETTSAWEESFTELFPSLL